MVNIISTTPFALNFARRLLKEVPIEESVDKKCGRGYNDRGSVDGAEPGIFNKNCSNSHDHSKERELFERSIADKYYACTLLREEAKKAFVAKEYKVACNFYGKILVQLDYTFPEDDVYKEKFREMELSTHQNLALTCFRLGDYRKSIFHCGKALALDGSNVKALVRRGMCYLFLSLFEESARDFNKALEVDSECVTAKEQLRILDIERQKSKKSDRIVYAAMFGSHVTPSHKAEDTHESNANH